MAPCSPSPVLVGKTAGLGSHRAIRAVFVAGLGISAWLPATQADAAIVGVVRNASDQLPIVGARVSVQVSAIETLTDAQGRFTLPDDVTGDVVIVAAMKGYFNGSIATADPDADLVLDLEAVPPDDNPDARFADPEACASCHFDQHAQWEDSPMAMAGDNTWVYDIYDGTGTPGGSGGFVYLDDSVHAEENPASECSACHQPESWVYEPFSALEPIDSLSPAAMHGISCEVCHKIAHVDETKPNFPGLHADAVTVTRPHELDWNVQYGTLGDSDYLAPAEMRSSYQPQLRAAVCGACHQDKNDHDADGDFEDAGGIISEPTYLEWLDSPFGDLDSGVYADCVDCHMPVSGATSACNKLPDLVRPAGDIRIHEILGTTPTYLENAVTMTMTQEITEGRVDVTIDITNDKTGHHVPTGVTIRNMILLVEAVHVEGGSPLTYAGEQVIHDLGGTGGPPEDGYYGGLPGKLYAKINRDAAGNSPTFFTDAIEIVQDTRIPALTNDVTTYSFDSSAGGDVEITARLIYRRSWRALVDAKGWTEDGHGNLLADVQAPHFGHLMEQSRATVALPPPPDDGDTGTGDTGTGDTATGNSATGDPGTGDSSSSDTSASDTGSPDTGSSNTSGPGTSDGASETGPEDAGMGSSTAGPPPGTAEISPPSSSGGCGCSAHGGFGAAPVLPVLLSVWRRRRNKRSARSTVI